MWIKVGSSSYAKIPGAWMYDERLREGMLIQLLASRLAMD